MALLSLLLPNQATLRHARVGGHPVSFYPSRWIPAFAGITKPAPFKVCLSKVFGDVKLLMNSLVTTRDSPAAGCL